MRRDWTDTTERKAHRENRLADSQQPGFDLREYVKKNRHRDGAPAFLTQRQLDVLMRYVPGPLGLGMSVNKIYEDMNIGRTTMFRIFTELRIKFPTMMEKIEGMRKAMHRQGDNMHQKMRSLEGLIVAVEDSGLHDELVDIL